MQTVFEYVNQVTLVSHLGLILMEAALSDGSREVTVAVACTNRYGRENGKSMILGRLLAEFQ